MDKNLISQVPTYSYKANVKNVVDGDTFDVEIDLGFKTRIQERVRTRNIDTRETHFVSHDSEEYKRGIIHTGAFIEWIERTEEMVDEEFPFVFYSKDYAYGRVVGDIYSPFYENWASEYLLEKFDDVKTY